MTTAKSSAAASPAAENGGRTTTSRKATAKAAKAAPTVHAVPVDHQDKPGKPMNPKSLPVRPGEDPWTKAEINEVKQALIEDIARFESQIEISGDLTFCQRSSAGSLSLFSSCFCSPVTRIPRHLKSELELFRFIVTRQTTKSGSSRRWTRVDGKSNC